MSTTYEGFAHLYDNFMNNIPYADWSRYLLQLLKQYRISSGSLVELGCGTGTLTQYIANAGYHVTGIDNSVEMLTLAADKTGDNPRICLLQQDMQCLNLGTHLYDGFYCLCDSLNYILNEDEMIATFSGVQQHLKNHGIFIFDLKTIHFYKTVLGDQVFCDHQEQGSYVWENSYFEEDNINQYDVTFFSRLENGLYEKSNEVHHQRGYTLPEIIDFLQSAGLEYVAAYDAFTTKPPETDSERIYIIARNGDYHNE